jgi:hypothetical protein
MVTVGAILPQCPKLTEHPSDQAGLLTDFLRHHPSG